ncbi:alpha/beta fold hydrolase [Enterococcus faecalis]
MEIEKKNIQVADGSTIYFEVSGSGRPLFLLHGNGSSSDYFKNQRAAFSRYFTVYAIDSRAHGRSTNTSTALSFRQMAQDLKELADAEQVSSLDIVGFSDGANLAMVFTSMYAEMVHRLVLNAGNITFSGVKLRGRLLTYLQYGWFRILALFSAKAHQRLLIVQLQLDDIGVTFEQLTQFTCEVLVIVGKYDIIKRSHSLGLVQAIPQASFVLISHQGHSFAEKDPATFNHEVLTFLLKK